MSFPDIIAAGYLLVRPVPRPAWASQALLPADLVSASGCICPQFPATSAIDWVQVPEVARNDDLDAIGLPPARRGEARAWARERFETDFGWPGVFYSASAASEAPEAAPRPSHLSRPRGGELALPPLLDFEVRKDTVSPAFD